jgi:hypothetical protein
MLTALYALLFTLLLTVSHAVKAMKTFLRVTWAQVVVGVQALIKKASRSNNERV